VFLFFGTPVAILFAIRGYLNWRQIHCRETLKRVIERDNKIPSTTSIKGAIQ